MTEPPQAGSTVTSDSATDQADRLDNEAGSEEAAPSARSTGQTSGRRIGGLFRSAAVAWLVAAVAIALAAWFAVDAQGLRSQESLRAEALRAGELAALQLTTFTGADIDQWVEKTKSLATETFAQDLNKQYDQQLRADLRDLDVQSVGEVLSSFVQRVEGDEAMVFTVLRQTTRYPTFERTVEDEVRFEISLQREQGKWRVSDAQLLSPTPPLQDRPFLDGDPNGGG